MKTFLVCALFAVAFISLTSASCFFGRLNQAKHKWSTKQTPYCEYEGKKYGVGSSFTDLDKCMSCDCTTGGFSCCGIGYNAGTFSVPGCKVVADGCEIAILNQKETAVCEMR